MGRNRQEARSIGKLFISIGVTATALFVGFYMLDVIKKDSAVLVQKRVDESVGQASPHDELQQLIIMQKKMVNNAKKEVDEFHCMGLHDDNKIVVDTCCRLADANSKLAHLECKLCCLRKGMAEDESDRIASIITLDKEAVVAYKKEIEEYIQLGLADDDPKIKLARDKMTQKMVEIQRYEDKIR
jgi:hypothetical protein